MKIKFLKQVPTAILVMISTTFASAQQAVQTATMEQFKPNDTSLKQYKYPEWFRDGKFRFWAHWGALEKAGAKYFVSMGTHHDDLGIKS